MNVSETFPDRDPGKMPLPYVKKGKLSLIMFIVFLIHAGMLILPFCINSISDLINPPLAVEHVSLVDSPPNDNTIPSEFPDPDRPRSEGIPDKGEKADNPPDLPQLEDIPPVPQPQPEPEPEPEPQPQPEPEPQVKPVPQEKVLPQPEKVKPKEVKTQTKPKSRWKEIKISTKRVRRKPSAARENAAQAAQKERSNRINQLLKNYKSGSTGNTGRTGTYKSPYGREGGTGKPGGAGGPKGVTSQEMMNYYESVRQFLMRNWTQPNEAALNNTRPEVYVTITVDASGRITHSLIQKRSGNAAMDSSVEALLRNVKVLPKPPHAMQFTVKVNIER